MILLLIVLFLVAVELTLFAYDKYVWSFIVLVASFAAAYFLLPEFASFVQGVGWGTIATVYLPVYIVLGAATAVLKWLMFIRGVSTDLAEARSKFELQYHAHPEPEVVGEPVAGMAIRPRRGQPVNDQVLKREKFLEYLASYGTMDLEHLQKVKNIRSKSSGANLSKDDALIDILTPRAKEYVGRITFWVLQWPIVLLSLIVEDLILKIGKHVARAIDKVFNQLARALVGNAVKDM